MRSRTQRLALGWLEERAAFGRVDGTPVEGQGWTVASFRHLTSRALDPFPHHHNVIANSVTMPDGSRRGLDARGLYRHAQAASALATAEMRFQLSRHLGVRWRPGRKSGWEIDGISDQSRARVLDASDEIDDALRELEEEIGRGAHPDEIEHIVLRTRPAKNHTAGSDSRRWLATTERPPVASTQTRSRPDAAARRACVTPCDRGDLHFARRP